MFVNTGCRTNQNWIFDEYVGTWQSLDIRGVVEKCDFNSDQGFIKTNPDSISHQPEKPDTVLRRITSDRSLSTKKGYEHNISNSAISSENGNNNYIMIQSQTTHIQSGILDAKTSNNKMNMITIMKNMRKMGQSSY